MNKFTYSYSTKLYFGQDAVKKTIGLIMTAIMVFALSACGQTHSQNSDSRTSSDSAVSSKAPEPESSVTEASASTEGEQTESADGKTLVVYFSWSGNTEEMASYIAEQTDGDLLEIEPKVAYPKMEYGFNCV